MFRNSNLAKLYICYIKNSKNQQVLQKAFFLIYLEIFIFSKASILNLISRLLANFLPQYNGNFAFESDFSDGYTGIEQKGVV